MRVDIVSVDLCLEVEHPAGGVLLENDIVQREGLRDRLPIRAAQTRGEQRPLVRLQTAL